MPALKPTPQTPRVINCDSAPPIVNRSEDTNSGWFSPTILPEKMRSLLMTRPILEAPMRAAVERAEEYHIVVNIDCLHEECKGVIEFDGIVYGKTPHTIVDVPCNKCLQKYTLVHEEAVS